jgi:hypothetical protein
MAGQITTTLEQTGAAHEQKNAIFTIMYRRPGINTFCYESFKFGS